MKSNARALKEIERRYARNEVLRKVVGKSLLMMTLYVVFRTAQALL